MLKAVAREIWLLFKAFRNLVGAAIREVSLVVKAFWNLVKTVLHLPWNIWHLLKVIFVLFKDTAEGWNQDNASQLAAALAFYTIFSLAPVLVIGIAIVGLVYGEAAAQKEIIGEIEKVVGREGARGVQELIENSIRPSGNIIAIIVGALAMLLGSSWVFAEMKDALNMIWDVPKPHRSVLQIIWNRIVGFFLTLSIGLLILLSIIIHTSLSSLYELVQGLLPGMHVAWEVLYFLLALGVITLLFAMLFKVLPDAKIAWGDVWIGAAVTALLFDTGRLLISLYLMSRSFSTTYGAAGSLVVVLLWVYYSAQIFLFGAEFTHVYARRYGSQIVPKSRATRNREETRGE
ncbi:MAG: YihY/virulence factor BrkB family protein [Chloroflexaceae bacterium]|nr:YihY/virulence factor BrkB family protein [Chloroflexaceae bacterium]